MHTAADGAMMEQRGYPGAALTLEDFAVGQRFASGTHHMTHDDRSDSCVRRAFRPPTRREPGTHPRTTLHMILSGASVATRP